MTVQDINPTTSSQTARSFSAAWLIISRRPRRGPDGLIAVETPGGELI